jgi:hypothetical protein
VLPLSSMCLRKFKCDDEQSSLVYDFKQPYLFLSAMLQAKRRLLYNNMRFGIVLVIWLKSAMIGHECSSISWTRDFSIYLHVGYLLGHHPVLVKCLS